MAECAFHGDRSRRSRHRVPERLGQRAGKAGARQTQLWGRWREPGGWRSPRLDVHVGSPGEGITAVVVDVPGFGPVAATVQNGWYLAWCRRSPQPVDLPPAP